jgi:formylglycine-generating enzyme
MNAKLWLRSFLLLTLAGGALRADSFGSGANSFTIDFVTIRAPGNPGDWFNGFASAEPLGAGAVPYKYQMAKYEVSERMIAAANALGGTNITLDTRGPNKPATNIDWFEAARFVNWLNTSSGFSPAYKFGSAGAFQLWSPADPGYNPQNLFRNKLARYVLPSSDEWFKAAYYDPVLGLYYDFPTGSDAQPMQVVGGTAVGTAVFGAAIVTPADVFLAGGPSPFRTVGQGGNVSEWLESENDKINDNPIGARYVRGGAVGGIGGLRSSEAGGNVPTGAAQILGFRIVSVVPEPHTEVDPNLWTDSGVQ